MALNAIGYGRSCHAPDKDCHQSLSLIGCALCAKLTRIGKVGIPFRISSTVTNKQDDMAANRNTTTSGGSFDAATVQAVWNKGQVVQGYDPAASRKDACGAWMNSSAYGTTDKHGWEVDHVRPVAKGGGDDLSNVQPLNWENNRHKSDDWPQWSCALKA